MIGHSYDAKTTPQMVIINPQGAISYDGAIDNRPGDDVKGIAGATNYVNLALVQALADKPVETAATRTFVSSVKYTGSWVYSLRKTQIFVIPRRAARRGISLFLRLNQRGIPHFVRNDKINYFFRSLFSPGNVALMRIRRQFSSDFPHGFSRWR
jgi:hypothetical protein